ncbi:MULTISPECIES: hypothetical protein [unclassified Bradyrhizobium]|uniref:hypothetical protein n=1 Tax=unclassified Bradyrhizobium TaxID=2631580 RepID=UPI00230576DE|nr:MULTISPECIES: hypothetical protein [unclassified Bradyrhizobium]MDA9412294.1 hypothetical protein [Bradyrhizobium sp. CCBAU 45384]MDA9443890.1 hypothetical protein [Bradyrhizobium sp. CCBAU 51745]
MIGEWRIWSGKVFARSSDVQWWPDAGIRGFRDHFSIRNAVRAAMPGTIFAALHSTRMKNLYFGISALVGALVLLTIWLGQHERQASIDRLEQWESRSPAER